MPRLDDPNTKLKKIKPFKRESLRPWDNVEDFKPKKSQSSVNSHKKRNTSKKPISKQLVNNKETIGKQLVNNCDTQLVNNKETIGKQPGLSKKPISKQLVNNKETIGKPISKQLVNKIGKQTTTNVRQKTTGEESLRKRIQMLSGQQKNLVFYIVEICRAQGLLYTTPIFNETLRNTLKTNANCVKTSVQRLVNKGIISRKDGKRGVGGFTIFEISETARNIIIEEQEKTGISKQLVNALVNNWYTNRETSASVVSSSNINNKTTTTDLGTQYEAIDTQPLLSFGFGRSHVLQIQRAYEQNPGIALSTEMIQDSINAMAFDLKHNQADKDFKKPPAVILTSLLKKGQPYSSKTPDKYLSPRDEAMKAYLDVKAQQHKNQFEMEQKLKALEYETWLSVLPEDELLAFAKEEDFLDFPTKLRRTMQRRAALGIAKDYFDAEIWPEQRQSLLEQALELSRSPENESVIINNPQKTLAKQITVNPTPQEDP